MRTLILIFWVAVICLFMSCDKDKAEEMSGYGSTLEAWFSTESYIKIWHNGDSVYSGTPSTQDYFHIGGLHLIDIIKIEVSDTVGFVHWSIPIGQTGSKVFNGQWDTVMAVR